MNRPTPQCLAGPHWRHEKWVQTAHRLGISVLPVHRQIRFPNGAAENAESPQGGATITIVGQKHVGSAEPVLIDQARSLADAARVDLLAVRFSGLAAGACFVEASLWPDIGNRAMGILECLRRSGGAGLTMAG